MAPPLIQLKDIALTFGGTPLAGRRRIVGVVGERVCLIGRNGSGKSTLLKIAAGIVEPDAAAASCSPAPPSAICRRSRIFGITRRRWPMSRPASIRATIIIRRAILSSSLVCSGDEDPAHVSGGEARRAALARVLAPSPDILLLDEPTNHLDLTTIEWLEGELESRRCALVIISHDRRFLSEPVALARPGSIAARSSRSTAVSAPSRVLARRGAGRGRTRPAQARPQDRQRGALAALRRLRPPQAQRQAARQSARTARPAPHLSRRDRQRQSRRRRSRQIRQAGDRGQEHQQILSATAKSSTGFRSASSAATASALSARMAPARPR